MNDIVWTWQISEISNCWFANSNNPMPDTPTMVDVDQRTDSAIGYTQSELIDYKLREYQDREICFIMRYCPD